MRPGRLLCGQCRIGRNATVAPGAAESRFGFSRDGLPCALTSLATGPTTARTGTASVPASSIDIQVRNTFEFIGLSS
jgi:hypothetical protein